MIQPPEWSHLPDAGAQDTQATGPVFADPSGQRRRLMRVLGGAASLLLIVALVMAGVGLFGGPDTPFSVFGAPAVRHQHGTHGAGTQHGHRGATPGSASRLPSGGSPGTGPTRSETLSPSPSSSADHSPAPSSSGSPAPTNKAGKTPPGQGRSKRPHPSPTPHGR